MKQISKFFIWVIVCFTLTMLYCYYNYQFWTHLNTDNFKTLIEFRGDNIRGFRGQQILIHHKFKPYMIRIDIRHDKSLRWGGTFKKEDPIHIDYPINLKSKKNWLKYNRLCNKDYLGG